MAITTHNMLKLGGNPTKGILSAALIAGILFAEGERAMNAQSQKSIILGEHLIEIGNRFDVYFTFEVWRAKDVTSILDRLATRYSGRDSPTSTVASALSHLKKVLPDTTIRQSRSNRKIVHIIDDTLVRRRGYVLDQKVSIEYSGLVGKLPDELGKGLDGIGTPKMGDWRQLFNEYVTRVDVKAKKQGVRDVLSGCVPLPGYGRFLWQAVTREEGGKLQTTVQYYGPKKRPGSQE